MSTPAIEERALIRHMEKICASPEFRSKQVLCRFLSYIISETLAGREDDIKAFSIGVDVFNKDENFDPGQDTLVRINAGRLRRMLDLYYSHTGKKDELRIEIPKGGYAPTFIRRPDPTQDPEKESSPGTEEPFPLEASIAVLAFKDLSDDPSRAYFARGFSYELLVELTQFEDLQVYNYLNAGDHPEKGTPLHTRMLEKKIRFTVGGAIHGDHERINILVDLRDLHQAKQIWCERYTKIISKDKLIDIQQNIVQDLAGKLGGEYGIILRRLSRETETLKSVNPSTHTAVLKYYNQLVNNTPETVRDAFEALNKAVEVDPRCGIALSCLANLHGNAYSLDFGDPDKSYETMGKLAEQAYSLDPNILIVQNGLIYKCFLYEEKERFFHLADRMLERNPKSTLRLGALGFHLSLYGDWERGKQILDSVMQGNLEYPRYFHGATTLYYYRDKDYEKALKEANNYQVPGFFWGPMLRAAALGQLSRVDEAQMELEQLFQIKPDFEKKAPYLISRFVKEDSLVEQLISGLQKAGLSIPTMIS
jgi:TolB-like protein